jgi:hypothetical protein
LSDSTLFVVRVWRQHEAFRASVRRVDDEDTRLFDAAIDLARYLEGSVGAANAARPRVPAPRGEPSN